MPLMLGFVGGQGATVNSGVTGTGKLLRDEIDASGTHSDRDTTDLTVSLAADRRDAGGISNINLGLGVGDLEFENAAARNVDAAAARTRGPYDKLTLSLARLQGLSASNSLYLAFNGQWADKNLDSSEQLFLGGPNSVRAYDVGVVGGAQGGMLSAELRHNLGSAWQALGFVDSGTVEVYKNPLSNGENRATLAGAGLGCNWVGPQGWSATGSVAAPFGNRSPLAGDTASARVWLEVRKSFHTSPKPP
jgi:hemolysin activation/secretion protein